MYCSPNTLFFFLTARHLAIGIAQLQVPWELYHVVACCSYLKVFASAKSSVPSEEVAWQVSDKSHPGLIVSGQHLWCLPIHIISSNPLWELQKEVAQAFALLALAASKLNVLTFCCPNRFKTCVQSTAFFRAADFLSVSAGACLGGRRNASFVPPRQDRTHI